MSARLSAFVIWSLVAAIAVFWALRFGVDPVAVPAHAAVVAKTSPLRGDLSRLFGAAPLAAPAAAVANADANARFRLVGIMAPKRADPANPYGLALIAVDGKPARAYRVGSVLDDGLVLQSVSLRTAAIGPPEGERSVLLELPALPAPATGVLPPGLSTIAPGPLPAAPLPPPAFIRPPLPTPAPAVGVPPPAGVVPPAMSPGGEMPPNPGLPPRGIQTQ